MMTFSWLLPQEHRSSDVFPRRFQGDCLVNILFKDRADLFVLFQCQVIQGDASVNAQKYQTSYDTMGITERYAMVYQIICCICGIGKTVFALSP